MSALLQLTSVETDIAGSRILRGVNLAVNAGEVVALMGRNGVGKTTTLRTITGLLPVRSGTLSRRQEGAGEVQHYFSDAKQVIGFTLGLLGTALTTARSYIDTTEKQIYRDEP